MMIPLVDLQAQYAAHRNEIQAAVQRVLARQKFILGEEAETFESEFARYVGAMGAVGVSSGTAALRLALQACEIGPGDEVITVAHTFIATVEAILHVGAKPVFADIDPHSFTLDPASIEAVITPRTRAIIPVHLYGQPAAMTAIAEIASRRNLWLIEDAAQAHGAEHRGRRCGSIGHLACFSFYPGKNLGAYGDAGIVTGTDEQLLARVRRLRDHGRSSKYIHTEIGFCDRLDELQAAVLLAKLPHLDEWDHARIRSADYYRQGLGGTDVQLPGTFPENRHVYHLFVIRTPRRDDLHEHLQAAGIHAGVHYPLPLHRQPALAGMECAESRLPQTERAAAEVLSLPMYPEITQSQLDTVTRAVRVYFGHSDEFN